MYQVMLTDDEPTALNLLQMIIEKKCDGFQVAGIAYNGQEALEKIKELHPDVLITDIQMPVMNGLDLIGKAREEEPELMSIVISGYQEFEYAKQAMRYGVTDYILKPIVPSELCAQLEKVKKRLDISYYRNRNVLMHRLVNEIPVNEEELKNYFQSGRYYGAITRRNGLPIRFSERGQKEIFSDIHEWMLTYGRDDQETLYLCPKELVEEGQYVEMIKRHIEKEQPDASYLTTVICKNAVSVDQIGEMVKDLYRMLDTHIILGKSQTLYLDGGEEKQVQEGTAIFDYLQELEYLAKNQKYERLQNETDALIRKWGEEEKPQIWMEGRLRQICYLLQRYDSCNMDYRECEFLLDEAFANAENIKQLIASMNDIFFKDKKEDTLTMQKLNTEEYFQKIKA